MAIVCCCFGGYGFKPSLSITILPGVWKSHLIVCNNCCREAGLCDAHTDDVNARRISSAVCLQGFFEDLIYLRPRTMLSDMRMSLILVNSR